MIANKKPIKFVSIYLFFTLFTYVIIYRNKFNISQIIFTFLIVSIYYICLILGFMSVKRSNKNTEKKHSLKFIKYFLLFSGIMTIIISIVNIASFYSSFKNILNYLFDPGKAYDYVKYVKRNGIDTNGVQISSYIGVLLNSLTFTKYVVVIFLPMYWKRISKKIKILLITSIVVYVLQSFLIGAMINMGSLFIATLAVFFYLNSSENSDKKTSNKQKRLIILISTVIFIIILFFLGSRKVFEYEGFENTPILFSGLLGILFYISHGYVGLTYCFQLPFKFTWGFTTFRGLANTINPLIGINSMWDQSYLFRNQIYNGWPALQVWSTAFPWMASDFSFWLIPIIMGIMGRFMGNVWREAISSKNPYAVLMMSQLLIFCFMLPANNQLFHTFGNSMGTIVIFILYILSKRLRI